MSILSGLFNHLTYNKRFGFYLKPIAFFRPEFSIFYIKQLIKIRGVLNRFHGISLVTQQSQQV